MIILDTNVVSELIKETPNQAVVNWLSRQSVADLGLTTIVAALRGIDTHVVNNVGLETAYPTFFAAMDDDFNSAKAISELFAIAKNINKADDEKQRQQLASELKSLGNILGLLQDDLETFLQGDSDNNAEIEALINARNQARADKDWAKADTLRDQLNAMGVEIEDAGGKTTWRMR